MAAFSAAFRSAACRSAAAFASAAAFSAAALASTTASFSSRSMAHTASHIAESSRRVDYRSEAAACCAIRAASASSAYSGINVHDIDCARFLVT
eukprot:3348425-Prymnesium_polylepis.1